MSHNKLESENIKKQCTHSTLNSNNNLEQHQIDFYNACMTKKLSCALELLDSHENNTEYIDENGNTPLMYAIINKWSHVSNKIIEKNKTTLHHVNNNKESALSLALHYNMHDIVTKLVIIDQIKSYPLRTKILLFHHYKINKQLEDEKFKELFDFENETKFIAACEKRDHLNASLLLDSNDSFYLDFVDYNGFTMLMYSIKYSLPEISHKLLRKGFTNFSQTSNDGDTALSLACYRGYLFIANELIDSNNSNPNQRDMFNHTALYYAIRSNMSNVACKLIKLTTLNSHDFYDLLYFSCTRNLSEVALLLIKTNNFLTSPIRKKTLERALNHATVNKMDPELIKMLQNKLDEFSSLSCCIL